MCAYDFSEKSFSGVTKWGVFIVWFGFGFVFLFILLGFFPYPKFWNITNLVVRIGRR